VPQRIDVVRDLANVDAAFGSLQLSFVFQKVNERSFGSFNLAGENRFTPHVHEDEEVRVRQDLSRTDESPKGECSPF
jgi:hypothetical protein